MLSVPTLLRAPGCLRVPRPGSSFRAQGPVSSCGRASSTTKVRGSRLVPGNRRGTARRRTSPHATSPDGRTPPPTGRPPPPPQGPARAAPPGGSPRPPRAGVAAGAAGAPDAGVVTDEMVECAVAMVEAAAGVTRRYFRTPVGVDHKGDDSPVTIADREAEDAMRRVLEERFPGHAVFGEERPFKEGEGEGRRYVWVMDPIDGTKSFIIGKPLFGTLVSLTYDGRPVLGVIDQSVSRERWVGRAGHPTTLNGDPVRTRPCPELRLAYLQSTTPAMFEGALAPRYERLRSRVRIPMFGCDCYAYGLLALGLLDLVAEADLKPYDYMALVPVVEGAGGVMTDWEGRALAWSPYDGADFPGEVLAAGDPEAHRQALEALRA